MYIRTKQYHGFQGTYQDIQTLCNQITGVIAKAPAAAQPAIQNVLSRKTPFTTPGFGTVKELVDKLKSYNPPAGFYDQDIQVLQQALNDIVAAIQAVSAPGVSAPSVSSPTPTAMPTPAQPAVAPQDTSSPLPTILMILAITLVVAGVVMMLKKKKAKEAAQTAVKRK